MDPQPVQPSDQLLPEPEKSATIPWRDYLWLLLGSGSIVLLDTWSKAWTIETIPVGGAWLPDTLYWLMPYARLVHTSNVGTAFSMFDSIPYINLIISILAVAVSVAVIVIFPKLGREEKMLRLAVIFQLAGAIGNLVSRIQYGHVIDFISVGNFAIFNIADASITVGVALMLLSVILEETKNRGEKITGEKAPED